MARSSRWVRRVVSFTRRWGLPIIAGAGVGLWYTAVAMPPLVERYGPAGGVLASPAGIGLGLLVAVFAALFGRLLAATRTPNQALQQTAEA